MENQPWKAISSSPFPFPLSPSIKVEKNWKSGKMISMKLNGEQRLVACKSPIFPLKQLYKQKEAYIYIYI